MSAIITGVLKLTVGLLSKKIRTYGAGKLQNGGLADKAFRNLIVRELDDIKSRLTASNRKELYNGISCLNRGVERLNMCFSDSVGGTCQSEVPNTAQKEGEDSLTSMEPSEHPLPCREQVFTFADIIGRLKIISNKRYELAEESFKNAARDAGLAFNNHALSIEDRILACKVCIISAMLQHLADPEFAVTDCMGYLKELHAQPSICEIFTVHARGGLKSLYGRDKRNEIVESVITINLFLLDFITTVTKRGSEMNMFDWPLIKCDTNVYHPIYYEAITNMSMMNELKKLIPPWCMKIRGLLPYGGITAVNSNGDIILWPDPTKCSLVKLDRETCELQPLNIPALEEKRGDEVIKCNYVAVDEDDTVYVLTCYSQDNRSILFVCDKNGNIKCHRPLELLEGRECQSFEVTKGKNKKLVFCCEVFNMQQGTTKDTVLYVSDSNGQLKNCIPVSTSDNRVVKDMFSSSYDGEIILVTVKKHHNSRTLVLYVYSLEECQLKQTIQLTLPNGSGPPSSCTVKYNYHDNHFICLTRTMMGDTCRYLQFCAENGELRKSCDLNVKHLGFKQPNLCSHSKGKVALVCQNGALYT